MTDFKLEENCLHYMKCRKFGTAYCPCDYFEEKSKEDDNTLEDGFWNGSDIPIG